MLEPNLIEMRLERAHHNRTRNHNEFGVVEISLAKKDLFYYHFVINFDLSKGIASCHFSFLNFRRQKKTPTPEAT